MRNESQYDPLTNFPLYFEDSKLEGSQTIKTLKNSQPKGDGVERLGWFPKFNPVGF